MVDGSLIFDTQIDTSGVTNAKKVIEKSTTTLGNAFKKLGKLALTAFSVKAIINFSKQALEAASDLQEVQNVVDVAFGSMSDTVDKWAKTTVEKFGMSELKAKQFASTYAAMGKGIGLESENAAAMAIGATERIGDIASFYNKSFEEVDTMMKSIWTGETESLKRIGVVMTETNLKAFALSQGITQNYKDMDQATKTQLRYAYVMQQTALAQGDFMRTSDSWANQTRILSEQFNTLKISIGTGLIQALTPALKYINLLMTKINQLAAKFSEFTAFLFGEQSLGNAATQAVDATGAMSAGINSAADAEKALGDEIEKTTKKQQRQLMSFDQLNRLGSNDNSNGGSSGLNIGDIGAIQSSLGDVQKKFDKLSKDIDTNLAFTVKNVLFKWKDLTEEDIAEKILTGFCALIGGIIGFTLGGPKGAIIGLSIGATLGILISSLTFNNDGKLSKEEVMKAIIIGLGTVTSGILGGIAFGPKGVAAGLAVGLLISLMVSSFIFNDDGEVTKDEITKLIITGLGALAGGILGGIIGGPTGIIAGASIGLLISAAVNSFVFDADGKMSSEEIGNLIITGLVTLLGGVIGAVVGGPLGCAIGLSIGVGISAVLEHFDFGATLGEAIDNFNNAGTSCREGFKNGWDEGGLIGAITQGFGNLITKVKAYLGIHSPSTVFKGIGQNTIQGFYNGILDKWKLITNWWNTKKVIFTKAYWKTKWDSVLSGIKSFVNTGIGYFEKFVNWVITGVNKLIGAVNKIKIDVPEWLQGVTGASSIGFNLRTVEKVTLPRLASGTVIPANYGEFAAILGDNKRETEVVSPLSTIEQAVENALKGMSFTIEPSDIYMDGDKVGKVVFKVHNNTVARTGRTPLKGVNK